MDNFFIVENKILDKNQIAAITSKHKSVLVVASAGSGKTTTIVGKVKYLLEVKKALPEEILVISYTKTSATEMKERIEKECRQELSISTFHKLGLEILKTLYINDFKILSEEVRHLILSFILKELESEEYKKNVIRFIFETNKFDKYEDILKKELYRIYDLVNLLAVYINLMKQNNYSLEDLVRLSFVKRYRLFLEILKPIYYTYQNYLKKNNYLDFNDMINLSTKFINEGKVNLKYKYVIIDEYQDISKSRYELIKAIISKTNAAVFCVGDDFQCIYSFAGSRLEYFVNFSKYYQDTKRYIINKTYRFNNYLVKVSSKFIAKNPQQIKKKIISNQHNDSKTIKLIKKEEIPDILKSLPNFSSVLLLGRYKKDYDLIIKNSVFFIDYYNNHDLVFESRVDLNIRFLTVHEAKGLEADYVFILNNQDKRYGFPSKIIDEKILKPILPSIDIFPYAEERRLFYVAITRAKKVVYLIVDANISIFIKEINSHINII